MSQPQAWPREVGFELGRALIAQPAVAAALGQLTAAATDRHPRRGRGRHDDARRTEFETAAPTSELPGAVDALQYEFGGPCIDALLEPASPVRVDDLRAETRWPEFAAAAVEQTPVRSMLSCGLYLEADNPFGSLNLYGTPPRAFDPAAARTAQLLTGHAALAIARRRKVNSSTLTQALEILRGLACSATGIRKVSTPSVTCGVRYRFDIA